MAKINKKEQKRINGLQKSYNIAVELGLEPTPDDVIIFHKCIDQFEDLPSVKEDLQKSIDALKTICKVQKVSVSAVLMFFDAVFQAEDEDEDEDGEDEE